MACCIVRRPSGQNGIVGWQAGPGCCELRVALSSILDGFVPDAAPLTETRFESQKDMTVHGGRRTADGARPGTGRQQRLSGPHGRLPANPKHAAVRADLQPDLLADVPHLFGHDGVTVRPLERRYYDLDQPSRVVPGATSTFCGLPRVLPRSGWQVRRQSSPPRSRAGPPPPLSTPSTRAFASLWTRMFVVMPSLLQAEKISLVSYPPSAMSAVLRYVLSGLLL